MLVCVPVADLRKRPDHGSERISQVLFGHGVSVVDQEGEFLNVRGDDGYSGWMGRDHVNQVGLDVDPTRIVASNVAGFQVHDHEFLVSLPHGALLRPAAERGRFLGWDDSVALKLVEGEVLPPEKAQSGDPLSVAMQFVSCPYLWGGLSPYGFDCSGLTQTVFRRCSVILPRDSKDQSQAGEAVPCDQSQAGDLIFFPGHVAIHLGEKRIIHATRMRGMVTVESLDPDAEDCRHDLIDKIAAVRRIETGKK